MSKYKLIVYANGELGELKREHELISMVNLSNVGVCLDLTIEGDTIAITKSLEGYDVKINGILSGCEIVHIK